MGQVGIGYLIAVIQAILYAGMGVIGKFLYNTGLNPEQVTAIRFIGAVLIIVLFVLFIVQGLLIAYKAENLYCTMVGIGIMAQIAWQVFCNIAVVTNTLPNTGISLPFFSSGGTSLILLLAEMGVMINIGRGGERARLERENLRALREQREKEKSNNTIRLDPNMGY